jgi:hypothetical protein
LTQSNPKNKPSTSLWNVLTLIVVLATLIVATIQLTIFMNPSAIFNPFPPMDMPEVFVLPTPTESGPTIPPIWTPTELATSIPTETPVPTATTFYEVQDGTPVEQQTPLEPTETPFVGYYAFALQNELNAINSTIFKPDLGCNWAGVAGQVFDLQGRPVKGIRVWLRGTINGVNINYLSLTLESSPYGSSGFEFTIGETPVSSNGKLYLQLLDQAGIPISDKVYFDTFNDCDHNLILVNFKQVR